MTSSTTNTQGWRARKPSSVEMIAPPEKNIRGTASNTSIMPRLNTMQGTRSRLYKRPRMALHASEIRTAKRINPGSPRPRVLLMPLPIMAAQTTMEPAPKFIMPIFMPSSSA